MKIKKLEINNYKSIKKEQMIDFSVPFISLVGKNGSGKTNVLDAIFNVFDSRSYSERNKMDYRFYLELEDIDIKEFKDKINIDDKVIQAYWKIDDNRTYTNINRIKAPLIDDILNNTEQSIYDLANELKKELEAFIDVIKELANDDYSRSEFTIDVDFQEEDLKKSTNYGWLFRILLDENEELYKKVKEIIDIRRKGEELIIGYPYFNDRIYYRQHKNFKLVYNRPKLTSFESKYIHIDEEAIKNEIDKINIETKNHRKKIDGLYNEIERKLQTLYSIIDENEIMQMDLDDKFESVLNKVISACNPKIYYLRNENNQLFFKEKGAWGSYYRSIDERTIIDTFVKYKYSLSEEEEIKKKVEDDKLTPEEMSELSANLEDFINKNIPAFDKNMIKGIKVSKDLNFSIVEKSGDIIPFSQTNSGRRWYYTYFLVKGCLKPGDILLMDEPANNLHPEAQIQIRSEIEEISKTNRVIMTTHSPYMISPDSNVYYLEITEDGTVLHERNNFEIQSLFKNLGVPNLKTIIGDMLINNKLLSLENVGSKMKEVLSKLNITQKKYAEDYGFSDREIRRKLIGQHLTYVDIEWFCKKYDVNPVDLLFDKS
jgi:predicted ATPase